ncbi:class I SAM-dependent methyltransferase [Roseixanthobacter glucoisosaccharinicivorans]|uniref:class I SAM-dependent methyltransferase n=1 Tax=Roseixanthobacter glucoisosaccharinicivorans TaxID=3119923 RepID=UPI0037272A6A
MTASPSPAESEAVRKFDPARAGEYQAQSRIALAGYDACHELSACMLAAAIGTGGAAHILVAGAGGGAQEVLSAGALEPAWRFTAIDPSAPMLELAVAQVAQAGLTGRTDFKLGVVADLPAEPKFDGATLIGVLHHLPGQEAKRAILADLALRLKPGAPLILAGNRFAYAEHPLLLKAWGERWRMHGASALEVEAKLGKILQGADPPHSEAEVAQLLDEAGFEPPTFFFSSLFWAASLSRRKM